MTTTQVVETSVTVNNNSPIQDYIHSDDQTQPTFEMTPGFKPFTIISVVVMLPYLRAVGSPSNENCSTIPPKTSSGTDGLNVPIWLGLNDNNTSTDCPALM